MTNYVNLTGYHLTFDAEMTTSADMSLFINTYANGDRTIAPNDEGEYYADYNPSLMTNPFSFSNGALTINASPTPQGGLPYTSGMLDTVNTFSQNQGYFEIRAQVPDAKGFWPGFWMLAPNYSSEIDILEQPNNDGNNNYYLSVKTADLNYGMFQNANVDLGAGYHTYGFMWTASTIQFTLDGYYIGYANVTPSQLATEKLYILANLAVGGADNNWPGLPATGASAQFNIDYIRAFSTDPTVPGVAQEAISSPDGVDTTPNLFPTLSPVGTGPDTLVLQISEDAYKGDAQFTVSVDGQQVGGVYTAGASKTYLQAQPLTVNGNFGAGTHTVTVNFINDLYEGSPSQDRNLYVNQASLDGTVIRNSSLTLDAGGPQSFSFLGASTVSYQPTVFLGSGLDTLALQVSEDAYQGDAQFTVSVDGQQIGGTQTATSLHGAGATQAFDILGNFGSGAHTVSVDFLNDAYGGDPSLDRNLYVTQASIDNISVPSANLTEDAGGPQSFTFQRSPDTLTLGVSEDAYQGDAQYQVLVDGNYVGGTYTATASHATGQVNMQTITGNWGEGPHTVGIQFINDAYGGSPSLDRNLYINSVTYDNSQVSNKTVAQDANGVSSFSVFTPDTLTLHLAEDAYQGDAQFTVSVDGNTINQPTSVTALHGMGGAQAFSFSNALSAGTHDIGVTFLNDAYNPNTGEDRNLYVMGADLNGTALSPSSWSASLYSNGTSHFSIVVPS